MRGTDRWILLLWVVGALLVVGVLGWRMLRPFDLASPQALWGLLALVPLVLFRFLREGRSAAQVKMPALANRMRARFDLIAALRPLAFAATVAGVALLVIAMARPQSHDNKEDVKREGIDIVVALDVSTSMLARDLKPDRLEASKRVAKEFIDGRPDDLIGLVVYEGEAYTQCPLTTDHGVLKQLFDGVRPGLIEGGTAVGMGLATAVNRLRESAAKSKVIILITDGVNNRGTIQPVDAALIAEQFGIRVYTIGVGTRGKAYGPVAPLANGRFVFDYVDVDLDEPTMKKMAEITGGKYFRATDEHKLREIYAEIDRLEKTLIEVEQYTLKVEEFQPFALWGAILLLLAFVVEHTVFRGMA